MFGLQAALRGVFVACGKVGYKGAYLSGMRERFR